MNKTSHKKSKSLKIALSVIVGLWLLVHWTWIAAILVVVGLTIGPAIGFFLLCALVGGLLS